MIKIVELDCIKCANKSDVDPSIIGQKAWGLCQMPSAWTPPFFVVSQEMYLKISGILHNDEEYDKEIARIVKVIDEDLLGTEIIIRSSGLKEGMDERGKYESQSCNTTDLKETLTQLIQTLNGDDEIKENGIPLVVQKFIAGGVIGHLSNERRVAKEHRDFIYEYKMENIDFVEIGNVHLRNWRKKYDLEEYELKPLTSMDLDSLMKIVGAYYYYRGKRIHIEFVYKENILYLVQCDYEGKNEYAVNPEEYNVAVSYDKAFVPELMKPISLDDKGKYQKINNVLIYKELGERIPDLYILNDKEIFAELKRGKIDSRLEHDLRELLKGSLIIRTNIVSDELKGSQLSKRSNEVKLYDDAINFLQEACLELEELKVSDYIFILHNFIPAKAAAFVNAQPMNEFVEIQALWGLPEGLYYNAHDIIEVDTKAINYTNMDKNKFKITKHTAYKEHFIAPNESGDWVMKKLDSPYDWNCTLNSEEMIKDIAYRSRIISEHLNEELSIMWFIDIDKDYYGLDCIPWYHEVHDRNSFYRTNTAKYKKKYFSEKEYVIKNETDIDELKKMNASEVGIIKIQPTDDRLLRSKEFINCIGVVCKEKNISILLEGASLAHTFYQLVSTGANVLTTYNYKRPGEILEFNKLVRDNIPEIIKGNGESVSVSKIVDSGLKRALKEKLLEETYEVLDSMDSTELIEELADLEEVCEALEKNEKYLDLYKQDFSGEIEGHLKFNLNILEGQKQVAVVKVNGTYVSGTFERNKSMAQIVMILSKDSHENLNSSCDFILDEHKLQILKNAITIIESVDNKTVRQSIQKIREIRNEILRKEEFTKEQFEEIRNSKNKRKGGFAKGYILNKTFRGYSDEETLLDDVDLGEPNKIYELKEYERIDVDYINNDRLLVRLNIPLNGRNSMWKINRKKMTTFFKQDMTLRVKKKFDNEYMLINVEMIPLEEEQLVLEF